MIKAILFDYGGTLVVPRTPLRIVRTEALKAVYQLLRRNGLRMSLKHYAELDEALFARYAQLEDKEDKDIADKIKYADLVHELLPGLPKKKRTTLANHATAAYWGVGRRNYKLSKGTRKCLDALRSDKMKMAVISNHHNSDSLITMLKKTGIRKYFQAVVV